MSSLDRAIKRDFLRESIERYEREKGLLKFVVEGYRLEERIGIGRYIGEGTGDFPLNLEEITLVYRARYIGQGTPPYGSKICIKRLWKLERKNRKNVKDLIRLGKKEDWPFPLLKLYSLKKKRGGYFLLMEEVEGETLRWVMNRNPLTETESLFFLHEVATALYWLHQRGFAHCDLKPENIMIVNRDPFRIKITDLDSARKIYKNKFSKFLYRIFWGKGKILLTPRYGAPELMHREISERVDIYSLGRIMEELFAGREVPKNIEKLIRRSILPDPQVRLKNMKEFIANL